MKNQTLARFGASKERARFLKPARITTAILVAGFALDANAIYVIKTECTGTGEYVGPTTCPAGAVCAVHEVYICTTSVVYMPDPEPIGTLPQSGPGGPYNENAEDVALVEPVNRPSTKDCSTKKGNPIEISTGQKTETEVDFKSDGQVPLSIERTYSSTNTSDGVFGRYWSSNLDYSFRVEGSDIIVAIPDRGTFVFKPDTSTTWKSVGLGGPKSVTRAADGSYTLDWPRETTIKFDAAGKVTSVKGPLGNGYDFTYDATSKLSRVTAAGGRHMDFTWTGNRITKVVDPSGTAYNYVYLVDRFGSGKHLLSKLDFPSTSDDDREYLYEDSRFPGALTGKKIGTSRYSWFSYDAEGRAISTEHRVGTRPVEQYLFSYDRPTTMKLVVTETNPFGKQASYSFRGGKLESITGMPTSSCPASLYTQTRDLYGYPNIITDFNGNQVDFDYNQQGLPLKEVRGYGSANPTTILYDWNGLKRQLASRTVVGDNSVTYTYDTQGRITSEAVKNLSANGVPNQVRTTTFAYTTHPNGLQATVVIDGPVPGTSDQITKTYNSSGDLVSVANAAGVQITLSNFNGLGQPTRAVDSYGVVYDLTYDSRGRRLSTKRTIGAATVTEARTYDKRGRLVNVLRPDGSNRAFDYDNADRILKVADRESVLDPSSLSSQAPVQESIQKFSYNEMNEAEVSEQYRRQAVTVTSSGPGKENTSVIEELIDYASSFTDYDDLGREIAYRGNSGQNARLGYDESGNITSVTDSFGRSASRVLDAQNRLVQQTDTAGGVTKFAFDVSGRVVSVTDPRNLVTRYTYDGFGQLWREESPDSGVKTYTYDAYGRLTSSTDAALVTTNYEYDALGRVNKRVTGAASQSKAYDACGNGSMRVCGYTDPTGSTQYAYNAQGLVTRQTLSVSGTSYVTDFEYDGLDRISKLTYPNGQSVSYAYADGKARTVTARVAGTDKTVMQGMRYTPSGLLKAAALGNGLSLSRKFDTDFRLAQAQVSDSAQVVQGMNFGYDANNLLVSIGNLRNNALSQSLSYDPKGRVATAGPVGNPESFTYDLNGNRLTRQVGLETTTYTYDSSSNRLTGTAKPGLSRVWTYDAKGNTNGFIDSNGVAVGFHYDAFDRIDSSSRQNLTTYYKVNSQGLRVERNTPASTVRYVYNPEGLLLAEWSSTAGWTNYIWSGGEVLALIRNDQVYYLHNDQTARPEVVTNEAKAVVWTASDGAFDRSVTSDSIGGLALGFPGQFEDAETSTWYNLNRDYDSTTGRYLQPDPLGLNGGLNPYVYATGNPVQFVDPRGLNPAAPVAGSGLAVKFGKCAFGFATGYLAADNIKAAYDEFTKLQKDRDAKKDDCPPADPLEPGPGDSQTLTDGAGVIADGAASYGGVALSLLKGGLLTAAGSYPTFGNPFCSLAGLVVGGLKATGTLSRWQEEGYKTVGDWFKNHSQ
jgi:RHS repeat-associated protein